MAVLARVFDGEPGTRLPGSRRLALRREAQQSGLRVPTRLVTEIRNLAGRG
jgi:hypothetical protein